MPLNLEDKKAIVAKMSEVVKGSVSVAVAEYRGLPVSDVTELRTKARELGVEVHVVRNTLARRAVEGSEFACLSDALVGPVVLFFAQTEPGAAAKLLREFSKKNEKIQIKGFALDGRFFGAEHMASIANLPTRLDALAQLVTVIQAPVVKWVRTLAEPYAMLVRVMGQIRDQKQNAAG